MRVRVLVLTALALMMAGLGGCLADSSDGDSDGDGISDKKELALGTDPHRPDSDGDGLDDGTEQEVGTDPTDADSDDDGIEDGSEPEVQELGGVEEREYERDETPTSAEFNATRLAWVAQRTITIGNDMPDVEIGTLSLLLGMGDAVVRPWDEPRYEIVAVLEGRGDTEQTARGFAESMDVEHRDAASLMALFLTTVVTYEDYEPVDLVPGVQVGSYGRGAHLSIRYPAHLAGHRLATTSGSGDVQVEDFTLQALTMTGGSGDLTVRGVTANRAVVAAGSGDVTVSGAFVDATFDTGSGDVDATVTPIGTGRMLVDTGSGDATLTLTTRDDIGYDIVASNGSGDIRVDVDGTETVGEADDDFAHVRTIGFEDRTIQTSLTVDTGSGDIVVTG